MKRVKNDIILIAVLFAAAAAVLLTVYLTRSAGACAVVTVAGEEVGRYPLDEDTTVTIGTDDYNVLQIKDGYADVTDANCPDELCVQESRIRYDGETIVCLPHRMVVEIVGGTSSGVDAVAQ